MNSPLSVFCQKLFRVASFGSLLALCACQAVEGSVVGFTTDSDVSFVSAECTAPIGSFSVVVTTAGERANVIAGTSQTSLLAVDETLTVNGLDVLLAAGMNQQDVVDQINAASGLTGVFSDIQFGTTRVYTDDFGSGSQVEILSNVAASTNSSGFGTALLADAGVDVAGQIGGVAGIGLGDELVAQDIRLRFGVDPFSGEAPVITVTGSQGSVTTQAVPEPSAILSVGLLVVAGCLRRRR